MRASEPCECGHIKASHDTGWDASGCMVESCACRSYLKPKADLVDARSYGIDMVPAIGCVWGE